MLILEIEDESLEKRVKEFLKEQKKDLKVFTKEAIERFLDKFSTSKQVKKLDPLQHSKKISFRLDDDLDDIKPYSHIEDSAKYIKELRTKKNR
jgi:hypothetical protein